MSVYSTFVEKRTIKVKQISPFQGFLPKDLSGLNIDELYLKLEQVNSLKPTYSVSLDASFAAYSAYSDAYQSWEQSTTNVMLFISRINLKRAQETIAAAERRRKNGTDETEEVDPFFEDYSKPVVRSPKAILSLRKPLPVISEPTPVVVPSEGFIPIGTKITWTSQASGITREKTGVVLKYIAAGDPCHPHIPKGVAGRRINGINISKVDRYLVEVPGERNSEYYTPLSINLEMTFKTQKYKK